MENENFNSNNFDLKAFIAEVLNKDQNEEGGEVASIFFRSEFSSTQSKYDEDSVIAFRDKLTASKVVSKHVESYGGEGCGDDYWAVYRFDRAANDSDELDTVYVQFDGHYQSYYGAEFDNWFFVEPRQKLITVFEVV